ncbi:hypothetical protein CMV_017961 [Castanea mollissima]|uniref:Uncharacterized protein n=1 Tax=Castanea mollissima TaxID=60419 RepID=A0A8J4QRY5_9ROSI|nr:hypothetical protein CMV_017961 [Castanea mollissima]
MFGGKGMGGGTGSGGSMLRNVGRAVSAARTGVPAEPISSSSSSRPNTNTHTHKPISPNYLSLSSTSPPHNNIPTSATSGVPTTRSPFSQSQSQSQCDEFEWVSVDGSKGERVRPHGHGHGNGYFDDYILGPVPSKDEVQNAVSAIQQVFEPASYPNLVRDKFASDLEKDVAYQVMSPTGSELDWVEPSFHLCNSRVLQPHGSDRVYDAFHMLQTEPSVQRMVISLSSDKAVWDAVLNNEVVRELKESYFAVENNEPQSPDESSEGSNEATSVLSWIFYSTKAKVMEVFEKITKLVNELFPSTENEKTSAGATDPFQEKLKTSFLLSVVVLLIVAVTRAHKA